MRIVSSCPALRDDVESDMQCYLLWPPLGLEAHCRIQRRAGEEWGHKPLAPSGALFRHQGPIFGRQVALFRLQKGNFNIIFGKCTVFLQGVLSSFRGGGAETTFHFGSSLEQILDQPLRPCDLRSNFHLDF